MWPSGEGQGEKGTAAKCNLREAKEKNEVFYVRGMLL